MQETNVNNVKARLVCNVFDFDNVPEVDAFYSCIVLQHNPPPMQMHLLQRILARIRPGGVFLFQTVTHHDAYAFNIQGYLGWQPELEYEMHVLPMRHIVRAIQSSGLELLDVILDTAGGGGVVSNTFFGVRP
jgi:phospholipid N-methyltransferase